MNQDITSKTKERRLSLCGLEGCIGDLSTRDERIFKTLLLWNQIRGFDSTGVAAVQRHEGKDGREIRLAKEVGPPSYLWDTKSFDKCFYGMQNHVWIGHNRSKTRGEVTRRNAHPFLFDDIVGAHNGTLTDASKNRMEGGHAFKTDSEAIFNNIQVHGIEDTIARIDRGEQNSYALTWYDARDNTFNLIRNEWRPLVYTYSESHRTMYYSSLYETLVGAIDVEGVKRDPKPFIPHPDTWYCWKLPVSSMDVLPEPSRKKVENRKPATSSYFPGKKNNEGSGQSSSTNKSFDWENGEDYSEWEGFGSCYTVPASSGTTTKIDGTTAADTGKAAEDSPPFDIDSASGEHQEIVSRIQNAYKTLDEKARVETTVKETSVDPDEAVRTAKYEGMKSLGIIRKDRFPKIYESKTLIVHRDRDTNRWASYRWDAQRLEWNRFDSDRPPVEMPYNILDINARHQFKHEGKGETKQIFYRGFRGALLDQDHFSRAMQQKCQGCERIPEWGNLVHFIDEAHNYLCEYCGMWGDGTLVKEMIDDRKKVG